MLEPRLRLPNFDVVNEYMEYTTFGDRIFEVSERENLAAASASMGSEAMDAIHSFELVFNGSAFARPPLTSEGAYGRGRDDRRNERNRRDNLGSGHYETLASASDEPPSSLFSGQQTVSSITTWTTSDIEAATRSLVRLLLENEEVGSALRKALFNSESEAGLGSFVRIIGPSLASYAKDLQTIADTPNRKSIAELVQTIADDAATLCGAR